MNYVQKIQKANTCSILNTKTAKNPRNSNSPLYDEKPSTSKAAMNAYRNRMSMINVSDMLCEFYRANAAATVPKSQGQQLSSGTMSLGVTPGVEKYIDQTSPMSAETTSNIAAIATSSASEMASNNFFNNETMSKKLACQIYPRIKYSKINVNKFSSNESSSGKCNTPMITAIPTPVVVSATSNGGASSEIKPIINPNSGLGVSSVIKPVPLPNAPTNSQAAILMAALIRDGYQNLQQQIRSQEMVANHTAQINNNPEIFTFLRPHSISECETDVNSNRNLNDDDSRYSGFGNMTLMEPPRAQIPHLLLNMNPSTSNDLLNKPKKKATRSRTQAGARKQRKASNKRNVRKTNNDAPGLALFICQHCNKRYRWKSTLRRHEKVECGGKAPSHPCPYCFYKSKQRGNLGVHVRKHHSDRPQLASKRRSKYSVMPQPNANP